MTPDRESSAANRAQSDRAGQASACPSPAGRSLREFESFLEASRAAAEAENLAEALRIIAWRGAEALGTPESVIYECESWSDSFVPRASFERTVSVRGGLKNIPLSLVAHDSARSVLISGDPLLEHISDPDLTPASRASMERWGEKTRLTIPLLVGSRRVGLLAFYDPEQERTFGEEEMLLARSLAALAAQAIHADQLLRQMEERHARLTCLLQANRAISSSLDVDEVLRALGEHAVAALGCDAVDIFSDDQTGDVRSRAAVLPADCNDVVQQSIDDPDLPDSARADMMARGQGRRLIVPLPFGQSRLGTMVLTATKRDRAFSEADIDLARGLADQAALAINNAHRHKELRDVQLAGLATLIGALGAKEPYTQGHASRVAQYVGLLGAKLGWPEELIGRAEEAAIMHDVGKLAVSDSILLKPGPLTEPEWGAMRAHPETSEEILRRMMLQELLLAIRNHHERYDGSGYPDGLRGEEIPLIARAICVADAYDAMPFRRAYKHPLSYDRCRAELLTGRGSQFDPDMADAMLSALEDLAQKRNHCREIARQAASLIDADEHKKLQTRDDEETGEYREIQGILRRLLDAHEGVRYITTLTRRASKFVFVVDPERIERLRSHMGDEVLVPDEEMLEAYTGEHELERVVLNTDEFGVWVTGFAPLIDSAGETVGVVCVDSPPRSMPPDCVENTKPVSLASLLGEAGKRIARAEFEAITDGLTGFHNHRYLHEYLVEEISRSTLRGTEFTLLFIDIDHFKSYNDRWGHSLGDSALRAVAQIIQGEVRRADGIGRYGGEEFVAVLAETDLETGCAVAERIRQRVARSTIVAGTSALTVSIGLAVFPSDGGSKAELLERGDLAMYEAKSLGRDRIQAYSATFPTGRPGRAFKVHR